MSSLSRWVSSKEQPAPLIVGTGASNGLGFTSWQTWAFWRAELSPFVESPFTCPNGQRATMCSSRTLPPTCSGSERLLRLFAQAMQQVAPLWKALGSVCRVGFEVGLGARYQLPEYRRERSGLEARLARLAPDGAPPPRLHDAGTASFGHALLDAARSIGEGRIQAAVVGGVDTSHDARTMDELMAQDAVFDGANIEGIIPGEGAALLVLASPDVVRAERLTAQAKVTVVATGADGSALASQARSEGLGLAMRSVAQVLKARREKIEWLLSDVDADPRRQRAWLQAFPRSMAPGGLDTAGKDFFQIAGDSVRVDQLPECFGSLGAATMATASVLACESFLRGAPAEPRCMIVGSGLEAGSSCILLERP